MIAGYALANAIVVPITGWLGSVFGRRNYFVGSIALFTVASFLSGHATGITELIVFRFIQVPWWLPKYAPPIAWKSLGEKEATRAWPLVNRTTSVDIEQ